MLFKIKNTIKDTLVMLHLTNKFYYIFYEFLYGYKGRKIIFIRFSYKRTKVYSFSR